jgi:protein-L-isoaspartate(D-aspartate) O-methyltransferase
MNFNTARNNMLFNQIRTWDFIRPDILNTMQKLQREEFVPVSQRKLAFSDIELPIGHGQFMMKPIIEGRILQSLNLTGKERVLEVGTGSAYLTALLALSSEHVTTMDIHNDFTESAQEKLKDAKISNVKCLTQDIYKFNDSYKFDLIVLTGSVEELPEFLFNNIKKDGKIFAIVGQEPVMTASIYSQENEQLVVKSLFETVVEPLTALKNTNTFEL